MRVLIVTLALFAAASSAIAQPYGGIGLGQEAGRIAGAQAARSRDIVTTNELSTLQAQAQSSRALSDIAAAGERPTLTTTPYNPHAPAPKAEANPYVSIPDAALAASNARARAAADNRR